MIILEPQLIAEKCFLIEALLWAGVYRFPIASEGPNGVDVRVEKEFQEDGDLSYPNADDIISDAECKRVDLPVNPEWNYLFIELKMGEDYIAEPDFYEKMLTYDFPEAKKEDLRKKLEFSRKKYALQSEWDKIYNDYIELKKAKIFVGLREGALKAYGRPIPEYDDEEGYLAVDYAHIPIPNDFWTKIDEINWDLCSCENANGHFEHILMDTSDLFNLFPIPEPDDSKSVQIIAGQFMVDSNDKITKTPKKIRNRGRKPYDWDSFHLELTRRLQYAQLPSKQEACVHSMREWCRENWGIDVGRSTVLQKVQPFYDEFIRQKKS